MLDVPAYTTWCRPAVVCVHELEKGHVFLFVCGLPAVVPAAIPDMLASRLLPEQVEEEAAFKAAMPGGLTQLAAEPKLCLSYADDRVSNTAAKGIAVQLTVRPVMHMGVGWG